MLFQIHEESKISIKRLTDADLKRSPKSNQTHIGLSKKSLTFMKDNKTEYTAMLIYNSMCDFLQCEVGKILRKDGKQDAPNIKTGDKDENIVKDYNFTVGETAKIVTFSQEIDCEITNVKKRKA